RFAQGETVAAAVTAADSDVWQDIQSAGPAFPTGPDATQVISVDTASPCRLRKANRQGNRLGLLCAAGAAPLLRVLVLAVAVLAGRSRQAEARTAPRTPAAGRSPDGAARRGQQAGAPPEANREAGPSTVLADEFNGTALSSAWTRAANGVSQPS